jgi:hypothetical protein
MSERERWIVYPLLFLALGAALRDKLAGRTATGSIMCEELVIMDEAPFGRQSDRALVRIGRTERSANNPAVGYVIVNGEVQVAGQVNTTAVNAKQYAYRGVTFVPSFQVANWLRMIEQSAKALQQPKDAGATPRESTNAAQAPQEVPPSQPQQATNHQPAEQAGAQ